MGWKPSVLSKCPNILLYSLEKRIAPRCSVLRLLIAKGLIKEDLNLIWFLNERELTFATKILSKYQDTVPEITTVYRGKIRSIKLVPYISNDATTTDQQPSRTVSYLINSCRLSRESALFASEKILINSTENPDSVLELLQDQGFDQTQITKVVSKYPYVLLSDPKKTLLPKINVFIRHGITGPDLTRILSSLPSIFRASLNKQIIPAFDFLRSVVHTDENIAATLRCSARFIQSHLHEKLAPGISILKNYGVPDSNISRLMMYYPRSVFLSVDRFSEIVALVNEMGFDPLRSNFIIAVRVMCSIKKANWDKKLELYRSLGWSEDEFHSAFKVQPNCMIISEKKIKRVADFLLREMRWNLSVLSKCPNLLSYSLEKRIAPRCSALRLLISKGLIKDDLNLIRVLNMSEINFTMKFLLKYQDIVPEIVRVYQGKVGSATFGSAGGAQTL